MAAQFDKYKPKPRKQKRKPVPTKVGMDDFLDYLVQLRASEFQEISANPSTEIQKEFEDKIAHRLPTFRTIKTFVAFLRSNNRKYSEEALEEFINIHMEESEEEPEDKPVKGKTKKKQEKVREHDDDNDEDEDEEDNEEFDDEEEDEDDDVDEEEDEDAPPAVVYKKDVVVPSTERARLEDERREITKIEREMNLKKEHLYEANRAHRNGWPTVNPEGIEPQDEEFTDAQLAEAIDKLTAEFAAKREAIQRSAVLPDRYRENQLSNAGRQLTHAEETKLNAIQRDRQRFETRLEKASRSVYTKGLSNIKKFRINVYKNAEWMRDENGIKHIYITDISDNKYFARKTMIKHNGHDWYQANNAFLS